MGREVEFEFNRCTCYSRQINYTYHHNNIINIIYLYLNYHHQSNFYFKISKERLIAFDDFEPTPTKKSEKAALFPGIVGKDTGKSNQNRYQIPTVFLLLPCQYKNYGPCRQTSSTTTIALRVH